MCKCNEIKSKQKQRAQISVCIIYIQLSVNNFIVYIYIYTCIRNVVGKIPKTGVKAFKTKKFGRKIVNQINRLRNKYEPLLFRSDDGV